jgi:putative SOS response-associated peptidase YedK
MPLMVERDRWADWLDPQRTATDEVLALLQPAAPGQLEAYPVSTAVGNVRNNYPELIEALPAEGTLGATDV